MKRVLLIGAATAALLIASAPAVAFAADPPSAAVKTAICASASAEAVSGPADIAASRAQRELDDAKAALPAVMAEQDRRAAVARAAQAAFDTANAVGSGASLEERNRLKGLLDAANQANEEGNKARVAADQRVKDAETRLAAAQLDQRNAVALEAQVVAFVGSRSFTTVKTELCTTPAPTTTPAPPTTAPAPTTTPAPGVAPFANCDEVRAAGLTQGIPAAHSRFQESLDSDKDGLGCEPVEGVSGGGSGSGTDDSVSVVPNDAPETGDGSTEQSFGVRAALAAIMANLGAFALVAHRRGVFRP